MKISARNQLAGTVKRIVTGAVSAEVVIALAGGGEIASVITKASSKSLKLKKGLPVVAIIKASEIMVGVA